MVGLYETALDALATRNHGDHSIRPKIVASTATVRRAEPSPIPLEVCPWCGTSPSPPT